MTQQGEGREQYVIPRYRETTAPAWYHVLHGTVPGHQIDFIYSPEVPQGPLTQTHLAHLARIIKYIEPRDHTSLAFAIGNLSRDDVQHEPGHGGLALIFGLRVRGVIDHASRDMPPYAHGLLAVDRGLDYSVLLDAISTFYRRFLQEGPGDATGDFYRSYVQVMREQPHAVADFLRAYVRDFDDLPQPPRSTFGGDFLATEGAHPQRVTIVHAPNEPFTSIANLAATLGSVLYRSNVKWTSISNGREIDIPGGVTVRLVPEGEVPRGAKGLVLRLDEVPADDAEIAQHLFGAHPRETGTARRLGWREQMAAKKGGIPPVGPTREAPTEGPGARDVAREPARPREPARERESVRERESARERDSGHDLVRSRDAAPERPVAVAAPDPLGASAGAIAAALVGSVTSGQTAEGTAVLPPPAGASTSPVVEVDDAAKTLAAPLQFDSETTVDDAAATLTAPLVSSASPSPPAAVAPSSEAAASAEVSGAASQRTAGQGAVAAGAVVAPKAPPSGARPPQQDAAPSRSVASLNTDAAPTIVNAAPEIDAGGELGAPTSGKGRWVAIGAAVIALAVVVVLVVSNQGSPEEGSGVSSATTAAVPVVPSPSTAATPASTSGSGASAKAGGSGSPGGAATTTATAEPTSFGSGNQGTTAGGAGSAGSSSGGSGAPGTYKPPPSVAGSGGVAPSPPATTTPRPASTKTKPKATKLDDTNLD